MSKWMTNVFLLSMNALHELLGRISFLFMKLLNLNGGVESNTLLIVY